MKKRKYNPKTVKKLSYDFWEIVCFTQNFLDFIVKKYPYILIEYKKERINWGNNLKKDMKKIFKQNKQLIRKNEKTNK